MKVLLTGASGFLGRALLADRYLRCCELVACGRSHESPRAPWVKSPDLGSDADWAPLLRGVNVVIHAAALAHRTGEHGVTSKSYVAVNKLGTLKLAQQALAAGVSRFVFISSIGVNGSMNIRPFTASDEPNPTEPYASSKWEAEKGLWELQSGTEMEVVIIRPPLVYGPSAPGNFGSLVRWVEKGLPLPLGAIHNRRSLVGIDNLVSLIIRCIDHPAAANRVLLAGDGEDLSTTELLQGVAKAMGKPSRLIPVPAGMLQFGAALIGKKAMTQRLLGSLQVDISETCDLLDWTPPYTVEEGLKLCFERFD